MKTVTFIGDNSRITVSKDMELIILLMERHASVNILREIDMAMEYCEVKMDMDTMENGKTIKEKQIVMRSFLWVTNILDSIRMMRSMEKEFSKKKASLTK